MTYVSSVERIGIEKGLQQGMQQGEALALQKLLTKRFGAVAPATTAQIEAADSQQIGGHLEKPTHPHKPQPAW